MEKEYFFDVGSVKLFELLRAPFFLLIYMLFTMNLSIILPLK